MNDLVISPVAIAPKMGIDLKSAGSSLETSATDFGAVLQAIEANSALNSAIATGTPKIQTGSQGEALVGLAEQPFQDGISMNGKTQKLSPVAIEPSNGAGAPIQAEEWKPATLMENTDHSLDILQQSLGMAMMQAPLQFVKVDLEENPATVETVASQNGTIIENSQVIEVTTGSLPERSSAITNPQAGNGTVRENPMQSAQFSQLLQPATSFEAGLEITDNLESIAKQLRMKPVIDNETAMVQPSGTATTSLPETALNAINDLTNRPPVKPGLNGYEMLKPMGTSTLNPNRVKSIASATSSEMTVPALNQNSPNAEFGAFKPLEQIDAQPAGVLAGEVNNGSNAPKIEELAKIEGGETKEAKTVKTNAPFKFNLVNHYLNPSLITTTTPREASSVASNLNVVFKANQLTEAIPGSAEANVATEIVHEESPTFQNANLNVNFADSLGLIQQGNTGSERLENPVGNDTRTVMPDKHELFAQIVDHSKLMVHNGHSELEVNLKPEHLGKLKLKVTMENQIVTASFVAESEQVKQIIDTNLVSLRKMLHENGIVVENLMVSVGQQQSGNSNPQQSRSNGQASPSRTNVAGRMEGVAPFQERSAVPVESVSRLDLIA